MTIHFGFQYAKIAQPLVAAMNRPCAGLLINNNIIQNSKDMTIIIVILLHFDNKTLFVAFFTAVIKQSDNRYNKSEQG